MYNKGDLQITDPPCEDLVSGTGCIHWPLEGHKHKILDARSDEQHYYPCVYLPHSCQEWVIGGLEQVEQMLEDMTRIYENLRGNIRPQNNSDI